MNPIRIADSRLSDRLEDQCSAPCEAEAAAELEAASPDRPSNGCRAPSLSSASLSDAALASLLMSAVGSPAPEARWIFHRDSQDSQTGLDDISKRKYCLDTYAGGTSYGAAEHTCCFFNRAPNWGPILRSIGILPISIAHKTIQYFPGLPQALHAVLVLVITTSYSQQRISKPARTPQSCAHFWQHCTRIFLNAPRRWYHTSSACPCAVPPSSSEVVYACVPGGSTASSSPLLGLATDTAASCSP